jgi:hypothetical protein
MVAKTKLRAKKSKVKKAKVSKTKTSKDTTKLQGLKTVKELTKPTSAIGTDTSLEPEDSVEYGE